MPTDKEIYLKVSVIDCILLYSDSHMKILFQEAA